MFIKKHWSKGKSYYTIAEKYRKNGKERVKILKNLGSSYFEGECCPSAAYGYNRDKVDGCLQINCGLVVTEKGLPVTSIMYPRNTVDKITVEGTCKRLRHICLFAFWHIILKNMSK